MDDRQEIGVLPIDIPPYRIQQGTLTQERYIELKGNLQADGYILYKTFLDDTFSVVSDLQINKIQYHILYHPKAKQWEIYLDAQNYLDWEKKSGEVTLRSRQKERNGRIKKTLFAAGNRWINQQREHGNNYDPLITIRQDDITQLQNAGTVLKEMVPAFFIAFNLDRRCYEIYIPQVRQEEREVLIATLQPPSKEQIAREQILAITAGVLRRIFYD